MASALLLLGQAASEDEFKTEDWLVPLITAVVGFAGAVLGVIAGQRLSRKTQLEVEAERTRREREIEAERARHERELEQRRADETKAAETRLVRAVCRVLEGEFETAKRTLEVSATNHQWWPDGHTVDIALSLDDRRLLAAHLAEYAWEIIALGEHTLFITTNQRLHEMGPETHEPRPAGYRTTHDFSMDIPAVDSAIRILKEARGRLPS